MKPEYSIKNSGRIKIRNGNGYVVSRTKDRFLIRADASSPSEILIEKEDGSQVSIVTIDMETALKSNIVRVGREQFVIFTEGVILDRKGSFDIRILQNSRPDLMVYPANRLLPEFASARISSVNKKGAVMDLYEIEIPQHSLALDYKYIQKNKILVSLPDELPTGVNDIFLKIDYTGDTGMGFFEGELVADHFYYGEKWSLGLKKFYDQAGEKEMLFYFRPLYEDAPFLDDLKSSGIQISDKLEKGFELKGIEILPEYSIPFKY